MGKGKPLTTEEKEHVAILKAQGLSCRAIGREIKRDPGAVARVLEEPATLVKVENYSERIAGKYEEHAEKILDAITGSDIEKANLHHKVLASSICTDKARLIRGFSTSNNAMIYANAVVEAFKDVTRRTFIDAPTEENQGDAAEEE